MVSSCFILSSFGGGGWSQKNFFNRKTRNKLCKTKIHKIQEGNQKYKHHKTDSIVLSSETFLVDIVIHVLHCKSLGILLTEDVAGL